jgi:hypothetical protein
MGRHAFFKCRYCTMARVGHGGSGKKDQNEAGHWDAPAKMNVGSLCNRLYVLCLLAVFGLPDYSLFKGIS